MKTLRMSGWKIMSGLIVLLGSLAYVMVLAVINGSLGFLSAMGITVFGAVGIAKALGESVAMSYSVIVLCVIGCGVLRGLLRYIEQYSNHYIAFRLLAVLRDKIFSALRRLCPAKLESKQKGSIIAMITSDIETLEVFYAHTVSPICIAVVISSIIVLIVGCLYSWYIALVALVGYFVIGIVMPWLSSRSLQADGVRYRSELSDFHAYYLDSIKGIADIVYHNAAEQRKIQVNAKSDKLLQYTRDIKRHATRAAVATEIAVSTIILIAVGVGILQVAHAQLSVGEMMIATAWIMGSFGPVIAISALPGNLTQTFASGDRVLKLVRETPAVVPIEGENDFSFESVSVENLSFGYDPEHPILRDICMQVQKGEIVGIVGESGSGKSTLLKLLLRFWEKSNGHIRYNSYDIEHVNTDSLLSNVTMVSQSTYLFADTIRENLRIANPDATDEEIVEACKKASIHSFIMQLPQDYDQPVGVGGENLSAGEKQRIGLARAFLRGSSLILLDEPTSNVDSINEGIILRSLKEYRQGKGLILVSHRQSSMAIADRVYVIRNGHIEEQNADENQ